MTNIVILPCGKEIVLELHLEHYYKVEESCYECRLKDICGLFNDLKYRVDKEVP
jgi:hypothetical protein